MSNKTLDNLVGIKKLKAEPFDAAEFAGLIRSAQRKLKDARNTTLSPESRFDPRVRQNRALGRSSNRKWTCALHGSIGCIVTSMRPIAAT